jgi:hypothetical protein
MTRGMLGHRLRRRELAPPAERRGRTWPVPHGSSLSNIFWKARSDGVCPRGSNDAILAWQQ